MFLSTNKCEGIGKCIEECPTEAIRIINNKAFSCITCGACFEACPNQAIFQNRYGGYVVDRAKCNGCGICKFNCPVNSIHIQNGVVKGICARCGICVDACPNKSRIDGLDLIEEKQFQFLKSLNIATPQINIVKNKENEVYRNCVITDLDKCIFCGRCSYYCPTNAIDVNTDQYGICTKCRICEDLCPANAINESVIDYDKCVLCLNCLNHCPNNAVVEENFKTTIQKIDQNIIGEIISCLNCGLCAKNSTGDSLKQINGKMRFDPNLYDKSDLHESIILCPVSTLKENNALKTKITGFCVSCGKCVKACDKQKARNFEKVKWDGKVSDDCISCGICAELCPETAITLKRGSIEVDLEKCILCETCGIHCPKDAIPRSTMHKINISDGFNVVDKALCMNCKLCYKICPENAIINEEENGVKVDINKCIYCGACYNACPAKAFIFERKFQII
jgi:energy-converting hydrogenase B subunit K